VDEAEDIDSEGIAGAFCTAGGDEAASESEPDDDDGFAGVQNAASGADEDAAAGVAAAGWVTVAS
jgi:hypothetical protein